MRKLSFVAALIGFSAAGALSMGSALAQANPSAPQPDSYGTGVYQPGITSTGTAVDRPTTGMAVYPRATGSERGDNADSLRGENSAASHYDGSVEGRTSGGGAGGAGGSGR
jgi:hypothetical protein